jgi:DUF438 domain-containing protein
MGDLDEDKKRILKEIIERRQAGASPLEAKEKFKQVVLFCFKKVI